MKKYKKLCLAVAVATASHASTTCAQERFILEEVIVTAQKRAQSLQDVPISIQAVDGEAIAKANISRLQDLSDNMPNVTIAKSSTNARVYVRGIGTDSNAGFEQSVAIYTDGMYMGRGQQSKFPFIDIERVEVLKGPQGILFGKNATAGALNITTKNPGDEFEGEVRLAGGEYGETSGHLVLSGPLSDNLGGRVAVFGRKFDGYMNNKALDRDEEQREEYGVRATLAYDSGQQLRANLKYETGRFYTDGTNYQVTFDPQYSAALTPLMGEGKLDFNKNEANDGLEGGQAVANKTELDNLILKLDYDVGEHTLTSITSYSQYLWDNSIDADFSPLSIANQIRNEDFNQVAQELRLVSPGNQTLDYIVGTYVQQNSLDVSTYTIADATLLGAPITAGALDTFQQKSSTVAIFGQLDWNMTDNFTVTAGLRWGQEKKDVENQLVSGLYDLSPSSTGDFVIGRLGGAAHQLDQNRSETHTSPMLRAQWDYSDQAMIYASMSRGYKGGGFDASGLNGSTGTTPDSSFEFEEEKVTAYEIGGKMDLQNGAANLNWALYHSIYEDLQVSTYNGTGFIINNAAKAIVQGAEIDYRWAISEQWMLNANAAYLDFEWDEFTNAPCTVAQEDVFSGSGDCSQDLTGERGALTPELTASIGLQYQRSLGDHLELRSELNINYSDDYFAESDLDANLVQDSYTKVNLYLALASADDQWEIALLAKNLTDEKISSAGNDNPLIDFAYRRYLEPPRQLSIQGTWKF